MSGAPTVCTFENGMLYKMRQSIFPHLLVAAAGIDCHTEILQRERSLAAHQAHAARQIKYLSLQFFHL